MAVLRLALVVLAALAVAPAASAAVVELRGPDGALLAATAPDAGAADLPGATVDAIAVDGRAVALEGVRLLGGRVTARRVAVDPADPGRATVEGLVVEGVPHDGVRANDIVPLARGGYVLALQQARDGARVGLVGLRVHVDAPTAWLPAGSDILVGVPPAGPDTAVDADPSAVLALADAVVGPGPLSTMQGSPGWAYPLAVRADVIGCPFAMGSTHSPFTAPGNLESDNALDLAVPVGTEVYAMADGVIGERIGSLGSGDPRMAGLRLHLETATHRFYYAHLSRIDVTAGQHVRRGQRLGLSGSANGAPHLHLAQDRGDPAAVTGHVADCPPFRWYPEPW